MNREAAVIAPSRDQIEITAGDQRTRREIIASLASRHAGRSGGGTWAAGKRADGGAGRHAGPAPPRRIGALPWHGIDFRRVPLHSDHSNLDRRTALDGLIDHAVALRKLEQLLEPLLSSVGLNVERQPDPSKADRCILADPERAPEIEIPLGGHHAALERYIKRRRHRLESDAGTGYQRFP